MTNLKSYTFAAILAAALALPLAGANAEGNKTRDQNASASGAVSSQTFKSLDTDKSGTLSEAEFSAYESASVGFGDADRNSDGKLTLSELQNIPTTTSAEPGSMSN